MNKRLIAVASVVAVIAAALAAGPLIDALTGSSGVAVFRGNVARTGVHPGPGVPELTGVKWRFETGGNVSSSPAVVDGVVYVGSRDEHVYAVDSETGQQLWRFETGDYVHASPAVVDGTIFVWGLRLYAIDAKTGEQIWYFEKAGNKYSPASSPVVVDEVVYVGGDGYLYAVDSETGEQLWQWRPMGSGFASASSPAVVGGVVYMGSSEGYLAAADAVTGQEKWRFETGGSVSSSPAVVDGIVYVGSDDGHLYAVAGQSRKQSAPGPKPESRGSPSGDGSEGEELPERQTSDDANARIELATGELVDPARLLEAPEPLLGEKLVLRNVPVVEELPPATLSIELDGENRYPVVRRPILRREIVSVPSVGERITVYGRVHPLNDSILGELVDDLAVLARDAQAVPNTGSYVLSDSLTLESRSK